MKKLLLIIVSLFSVVSTNAQEEKLIYEKNWEGVEYSEWVTFETVPDWMYEATAEGLAISHPSVTDQIWQVRVISGGDDSFSLEGGHDYVVRLTMKVPSDGKLFMQLGDLYSSWYDCASVKASDGWQVIDIENQSFYSDIPNAHVLLGLGEMVGTTILKKVQVYERTTQDDYIPFVELGKQWHVVSNPTNPYVPCSFERYEMYDEVERDGKTYVQIRRIVDGKDTEGYDEVGLFREENRRVYKYEGGRDVMLYDFSLKEGDTFTYEYGVLGEPMICKVLKQGWLEDGPQIEMLDSLTSEGAWTFKYRKLRTWTIGYDNGSGDYNEATTWIEGVGTLKNTFIRPYATGYVSYLAYIYRIDRPGDNDYLPFSLYNMYGPVYGSELPKGVPDNLEDWHEQFSYELEGDRLHVSGNVSLNCGGYYYAYFTEERTDDPMVRKLHFRIEEIGELTTCGNRYGTDFYVSGLNPNINYIIVDNQGEEHPVINKTPQDEYRPFVEDGKVWKVGDYSGNPVRRVEYYYFDGDTIIDGKTCKQMMRQRYVSPDHPDYAVISQLPSLSYMGAWYEENKKVYAYNSIYKQFNLMYDFSLDAYDTLQFNSQQYAIGPKQTGELKGFKGVYRDVWMRLDIDSIYSTTWLERVGGIDGPIVNVYYGKENHAMFLMSCTVGDELVYFNDEYEDGATPAGARKNRIDFSHTTKIKPKTRQEIKSRTRSEEEQSLYGEYNEQLLSINLDPINDAYMVSITDESGKVVYEKPINAGNIVGLNIDISAYSEGRYIVTVDNSNETFTGELNVITTGIEEVKSQKSEAKGYIYNLQGQRLNSLQKGLNIVNGRKVIVR